MFECVVTPSGSSVEYYQQVIFLRKNEIDAERIGSMGVSYDIRFLNIYNKISIHSYHTSATKVRLYGIKC